MLKNLQEKKEGFLQTLTLEKTKAVSNLQKHLRQNGTTLKQVEISMTTYQNVLEESNVEELLSKANEMHLVTDKMMVIKDRWAVFTLIFFTYLPESQLYSNKFFHNFHLSGSRFTCPGLRASGLAWRLWEKFSSFHVFIIVFLISMAFCEFSTISWDRGTEMIHLPLIRAFPLLSKICGKKYAKLGDPSITSLSYR